MLPPEGGKTLLALVFQPISAASACRRQRQVTAFYSGVPLESAESGRSREFRYLAFFAAAQCWGLACTPAGGERATPAAATASASVAVHPIDFSATNPAPRSLPFDGRLRAALGGDEIDLAILANGVGAARLLEEVEAGGRIGLVALRALPLAPDARAVRGEACALLRRVTSPWRTEFLGVLRQLFERAPVGAGGVECAASLKQLEARPGASAIDRDLAASISASIEHERESAAFPSK